MTFLWNVFNGTIFFEEEFLLSYLECEENVRTFLSSFGLVPHNMSGIPPTLWLTMWQECEEKMSPNEDALCLYHGMPWYTKWSIV